MNALVILEGQQHQIPEEIADDDSKLLTLFATVNPNLANAKIQRNGTTVELIARKGTKGSATQDVLAVLDAAPLEIDPSVVACNTLQNHEFRIGIDTNNAELIVNEVDKALTESHAMDDFRQSTKVALKRAKPHSVVVTGF